jgi:hypothetical protein
MHLSLLVPGKLCAPDKRICSKATGAPPWQSIQIVRELGLVAFGFRGDRRCKLDTYELLQVRAKAQKKGSLVDGRVDVEKRASGQTAIPCAREKFEGGSVAEFAHKIPQEGGSSADELGCN